MLGLARLVTRLTRSRATGQGQGQELDNIVDDRDMQVILNITVGQLLLLM